MLPLPLAFANEKLVLALVAPPPPPAPESTLPNPKVSPAGFTAMPDAAPAVPAVSPAAGEAPKLGTGGFFSLPVVKLVVKLVAKLAPKLGNWRRHCVKERPCSTKKKSILKKKSNEAPSPSKTNKCDVLSLPLFLAWGRASEKPPSLSAPPAPPRA